MQRLAFAVFSAFIFVMLGTIRIHSAQIDPIFEVHGPTVVAFFRPATQAEMHDGEMNESLDDFLLYAKSVHLHFAKAGVDFHEVFTNSFRVRLGGKTMTFHPAEVEAGCYLVAPGKKPRVEYGVMTDADLLQVAGKYFGLPLK